jgi:mycothiol maleylpyruvate isomerase-like protein
VLERDARALLDEERVAWRPFEALDELNDAQLEEAVAAAHDWSGRDLIAHLVGWLADALDVARELTTTDRSETRERSRRAFAERGDAINAEIQEAWRRLPIAEVRRRFREVPTQVRAAVTAVPAGRWIDDPENLRFIHIYTIEHYEDHIPDLDAIIAAARPPGGAA